MASSHVLRCLPPFGVHAPGARLDDPAPSDVELVPSEPLVADERAFRRRVEQQRARVVAEPFALALVCVKLRADEATRRRVEPVVRGALAGEDRAAWTAPSELTVLVTGGDPDAVARDLLDLLVPHVPARAGIAEFPGDGDDVTSLLVAARAAAERATAGAALRADDGPCVRVVGAREVVVADAAMTRAYALLERLARSSLPVLVCGETGTGKENAAAALHHWSSRAGGRFVTINCAALPEPLVESELFGYERGAFTGAASAKAGLFEVASGGTLFLDEVGELSLGTQAKLLRALETQRVTRLGGLEEREVDVRIVAATNRDLVAEVVAGRFRQDLRFRLGAATVALPPLRERRRELPILARTLLVEACDRAHRPALELTAAAMLRLLAHEWPGNVRELRNVMDFVAATAVGPMVRPIDLPSLAPVTPPPGRAPAAAPRPSSLPPVGARPLAEELRELEKLRILQALAATGGVQARAAQLIGMPVRTLFVKLRAYGIRPRELGREGGP